MTQIFVENAFEGKTLTLYNNGTQELDFTFVKDTARGMILTLFEDEAEGEVFNITRGQSHSIRDLAETIEPFFDNVNIEAKQEEDVFRPKRGALDISKARSKLGYEPQYDLEDGIREYVETYREKNIF